MRIAQPNHTDQIQHTDKEYFVIYRDRTDPNPLAIFFIVYSKDDDRVLWESATYYNETELRRVAFRIMARTLSA